MDRLKHFVVFFGFTLVLSFVLGDRGVWIGRARLRFGLGITLPVAVLAEVVQLWVPWRTFDYGDLAANVLAVLAGTAVAALFGRRTQKW